MDSFWKESVRSQLGAAIKTLENALQYLPG